MKTRLFFVSLSFGCVSSFVNNYCPTTKETRKISILGSALWSSQLPTIEQLSKDSFMQQVQYGYQLSDELKENSSSDQEQQQQLKESLLAQLSHSDGIRGFMVSYLTGEGDDTVADEEEIPAILYKVLQEQGKKNPDELIPLACMNVVMPTAMVTMHQNEEQSASSKKTAQRGIRVWKALKTFPESIANAQAIRAVATAGKDNLTDDDDDDDMVDAKLVEYWTDFFEKWGYQDEQKNDIAAAMNEILSENP